MRIFNEDKTKELKEEDIDYTKGCLKPDVLVTHIPARKGQEEKGHWKTIKEYPNGGKDVEWIIDQPKIEPCEEHDEYEDILIYHIYTQTELDEIELDEIKRRREEECFSIVDRSQLWYKYNVNTPEREAELDAWYQAWLHITDSRPYIIPERPIWLNPQNNLTDN